MKGFQEEKKMIFKGLESVAAYIVYRRMGYPGPARVIIEDLGKGEYSISGFMEPEIPYKEKKNEWSIKTGVCSYMLKNISFQQSSKCPVSLRVGPVECRVCQEEVIYELLRLEKNLKNKREGINEEV